MKTKLFTLALIYLLQWQYLRAQSEPPKFESLKLNSSPAFVMLGTEPDNIQRPSTPTQFVAGMNNAMVDGKLQPNVAFEFSPYYLANPKKDSKQFNPSYYLLDKQNLIKTMKRTFSVSMGTSSTDKQVFGNLKPGTGIGLGLNFLLLDGKPSPQLKKWNDAYIKQAFYDKFAAMARVYAGKDFDISMIMNQAFYTLENEILPAEEFNTLSQKELKNFIETVRKTVLYDLKAAGIEKDKDATVKFLDNLATDALKVESIELALLNKQSNPLSKQGFMIEFSAGQAHVFEDNNFNELSLAKSAFWLTPSYRWDVSTENSQSISLLDLMAVIRFTSNNSEAGVDLGNYLDAGTKMAFTQNKWTGSLEFVYRHASETPSNVNKNHTYRLISGIDYKISDLLTFKFNFGTGFDGNTSTYTDPKKIFAIGGLNFGLMGLKLK